MARCLTVPLLSSGITFNQSINQSIRNCLSSRTNSRLIVKFKQILVHMMMSGYDFLKSQVFSCWRKVRSDCDVVISSGRVFQTRGPATENARSPTVERLTDGTIRRLVLPERNVRRSGRLAEGTSGPRYRGALPCKAFNTVLRATALLRTFSVLLVDLRMLFCRRDVQQT